MQICFNALKEAEITTEHIAGLLITTKMIVENIISAYKKGQNSNGDIG